MATTGDLNLAVDIADSGTTNDPKLHGVQDATGALSLNLS